MNTVRKHSSMMLALMIAGGALLVMTTLTVPPPVSAAKLMTEIEILMKDEGFHVVKGAGPGGGLELTAGMPTQITLRNEDSVAHEFVSTLFSRIPVAMSGNATMIGTTRARGFRIDPGNSVVLNFIPPVNEEGDTEYDLFWCNVHGRHFGDKMRGEILTVATTTGTGAF
ncbi:MAG: hypothetical protein D6690_07785 [Nitrospirae bacterium]|nr:MAG: hypothetical protein D6690_07785 [Nitrospirota bacterium]